LATAHTPAVKRAVGLVVGVALLGAGVLLGLLGLFALLYEGDTGGGGGTYVRLGGHEVDADLAGTVTLTLAFALVITSIWYLKRTARRQRL
jgi:divalent metal cation (Fe/Co/Zn/Cd) transporter